MADPEREEEVLEAEKEQLEIMRFFHSKYRISTFYNNILDDIFRQLTIQRN